MAGRGVESKHARVWERVNLLLWDHPRPFGMAPNAATEAPPAASAQPDEGDLAPDDLASLPQLTDDAVVFGIQTRFSKNKIYTQINSLLIAMNPYQQLSIYDKESMVRYKAATVGSLPPHVFGIATAAYSGLLEARSQVSACPYLWPVLWRNPHGFLAARSRSSSRASQAPASRRPRRRCCNTLPSAPPSPQTASRVSKHASLRQAPCLRPLATQRPL